jgi:hypothetical protein
VTWPLAFLEADRNFIVISVLITVMRLSRENVLLIEGHDGLFSSGIRFWSDDDDRDVIFWTWDPESIIDSLRILGWDAVD